MIFLTIGTHEPFDRLVRALDDWCAAKGSGSEVFGQITEPTGPSAYHPVNFQWVSRLAPADYARRFAQARLIISHAGMGSIITALHSGKPIVVMPRRGHLRETRNDHQFTTVKMLKERPGIYVADDENQLGSVIETALSALSAPTGPRISAVADANFTEALRSFLIGPNGDKT